MTISFIAGIALVLLVVIATLLYRLNQRLDTLIVQASSRRGWERK